MFKNSKLMKGVVLALALVLVLGVGVTLKLYADAAGQTVVYYVSESGKNTTGKDPSTAFKTFAAATEAANALKLAPGSEVKIIVVGKVLVETQKLDVNTVKDTSGNKVPLTITSQNTGSADEFSIIAHHYFNSSGSTTYEKVYFANDITFKDIIFRGEAQNYFEGNAPLTDPIDYNKLYRTRGLHVGNNKIVFDNCEITSNIPDKAKAWTLFCDNYEKSLEKGASSLTLKNGDYSNCTVYVLDQITPLWDLSLSVENASVGTVYAAAETDTAESYNAKSLNVNFKDATVSSFNPSGRGNVGVTHGMTAVFEGDTVVKNWVACMSSSSSTGTFHGDMRYYFRDNCNISVTSTDSNSEKIIYLTPPVLNGDLHVTVEGGTFNQALCTGTDKNKSLANPAPALNGDVYNEFKGGTFKAGVYCGMGRAAGTVNGSIYNNFYDGFNLEKGTSYFGGRMGVITGDVTNNFYGGTIGKVEVYMGTGYGDSACDKTVLKGKLITNIYGGTFGGTFWGGPRSQTVEGGIYNTFMGGEFASTFVAGGLQVITPEVHNVFKNGPDGSHAVLKGTSYLGPRGGSVKGTYNIGKLYNTFEGDVEVNGYLYCADGTQSNVEIEELVQNEFKGGTFGSYVYGTMAKKGTIISADVVNNFYDGAVFKTNVHCGGQYGGSGSITNNVYGGDFQKYFYGITASTDKQTYTYVVNGDVTNNIYGGTFGTQVCLGGMESTPSDEEDGTIYNNIHGGTFKYFVYGGNNFKENTNHMDVVNTITGGDFLGFFCAGSGNSTNRTITNNISGGHFIASHKEALHSEAGRSCFYGGDYAAAVSGTGFKTATVTNNISGGIFEERVYLGGRIATVGKINSVISGGIFNGDRLSASMYQDSASKSCSEVTLDIKPDDSDEVLFLGSHYTDYGVESAKVYWSYGLENPVKRPKDTIILHAAKKPIHIAANSFLNFDEIRGEVTFIQTEEWADGHDYVTVPAAKDLDMIKFVNFSADVTGSAEIKTKDVKLDNESASTKSCDVLVGSSSADDLTVLTVPKLKAINFVLDNNLLVNYYVNKADLEAYLENAGTFTYKITSNGNTLAEGKITDLAEADVIGTYVKIETDFAIYAYDYGKAITLDFAGVQEETSVYQLLKDGIANSADDPALADLLKAIYNYGIEAEELRFGETTVSDSYSEITYTGSYNGKASASSFDSRYNFVGTSLSIGKEVSLNFYLQAEVRDGLSFTATSANGTLSASRVVVTPFDENSQYNVVVSLRLDVASMDDVFTLTATDAQGTKLATCSNSVAYCCANYIAAENEFAPVSRALLAYIEKVQAL